MKMIGTAAEDCDGGQERMMMMMDEDEVEWNGSQGGWPAESPTRMEMGQKQFDFAFRRRPVSLYTPTLE